MNNLIGKKFRYKSKYGLSDWIGEIKEVFYVLEIVQGPPRNFLGRLYHPHRKTDTVDYIKSEHACYKLSEIEIID